MKTLRTLIAAFVLSLSLVLVSATSASAFTVPSPLAKGTLTAGAEVGVTGVSMFGRFSNPIGWGITAAQIGWFAYSTRDQWMPIDTHEKTVQQMNPGWTPPTQPTSGLMNDGVITVAHQAANGRAVTWSFNTVAAPSGANNYSFSYGSTQDFAWCSLNGAAAAVKQFNSVNTQSINIYTPRPQVFTENACGAGETVVGYLIAPRNQPGSGKAQTQSLCWAAGCSNSTPFVDGPVKFGEYQVDVKCVQAVTDVVVHITSRTLNTDGGVVLPSCSRLGADWRASGLTVTPTKPEIDNKPIPDEIHVPDTLPLDWTELMPTDPDWQPCQKTKEGCALDIWIDNKRCYESNLDCRIWTKIAQKDPTRVKCMWGTREISMGNCSVLQQFYNPDTHTTTGTQTTIPTTGVDTGTGTGTGTTTTPVKDPLVEAETGKCFPSGWGAFNPLEWIYKPVKCALTWAFVPTTTLATRIGRMRDRIKTKVPFTWLTSLAALPSSIGSSGCPTNWTFNYSGTQYPVLCNTQAGSILRSSRPLITVLALGACVYPFLRSLVYASVPVIKPTPGD